jgi:GNAT superfamily N-acetyltransferase
VAAAHPPRRRLRRLRVAEAQGQGLGGAVLALLLAEADAAAKPVCLGVLRDSPAARFYERHGFRFTHAEEWDFYFERPVGG